MDTLPPEMVEKISLHLTAKELYSCCSVSSVWRTIFDQDSLWKPHCRQDLEEYLRISPCIAKPYFTMPETESSRLNAVCRWRLAYMRESHLWNNWRRGNCNFYKIMSSADEYSTTGYDFIIQDFEDHAVFFKNDDSEASIAVESTWDFREFGFFKEHYVASVLRDCIELHDMRVHPPKIIAATDLHIPRWVAHRFMCVGEDSDIMVFNYKNGVQVFGMNNASTKLVMKHIFYFNESQKLPAYSIEVAKKMFDLDTTSDGVEGFSSAIVGKIFMGVAKSGTGHSRLHVWDLKSGEKLKEEVSPIDDMRIISLKRYETSQDVIVVCGVIESEDDAQPEIEEMYACCIYTPGQLTFYPYIKTDLTKGMICGMNGQRLLLYDGEKLTVVDYRKSKELVTKSYSGISEIHGIDTGIVFRYRHRRKEINVFNTSTFELNPFEHPFLVYFEPLCGNFLLMNFGNPFFPSGIWEIGEGFVPTEQLPVGKNAVKANKTCTRIVYKKNEILGLHTFREGCYW